MTWLLAIELHWECHTGVLPPDALDLPISQESHYTFASAASPWLHADRDGIISPTSYRLDNRNQAGGAKDSDEEEVILRRRKTTCERSQRLGQLNWDTTHRT